MLPFRMNRRRCPFPTPHRLRATSVLGAYPVPVGAPAFTPSGSGRCLFPTSFFSPSTLSCPPHAQSKHRYRSHSSLATHHSPLATSELTTKLLSLSPLESALTQNPPITPLESALPKHRT